MTAKMDQVRREPSRNVKPENYVTDAAGYPKILTPQQAEALFEEMKGFHRLPEGKITGVPALLYQ